MTILDTVHGDLVAVVRDFTDHELSPRAESPDLLAGVWPQLVAIGLDRALAPDDAGGAGLGADDFLSVLEVLAGGDAGVALAVLLNNAALTSLTPEAAAGVPIGARWTVALAPGDDEPAAERVGIIRTGRALCASGRLPAVLGAAGADGVVVAIGSPEPATFAVPTGVVGLTVRPDPAQLGLRAAAAADLLLAGVETMAHPDSATVEAHARALVRCGVAAISRGVMRLAYQIALGYARSRIQGGHAIIEYGAVGEMLAKMSVRLHTLGAGGWGVGCLDPAAALAHKIAVSDAAMATALDAMQVLGGIGYMADPGPNSVEKLLRDAKYCQLYPERNWLGRAELIARVPGAAG